MPRRATETLALVLTIVLAVALVGIRLASNPQTETTSSSTSSALSRYSSSTSVVSTQSTTIHQTNCLTNVCGNFSYSPSSPLAVTSLQATVNPDFSVTLGVTFLNAGDSPIYFDEDLGISISNSSNPILQTVGQDFGPVCAPPLTATLGPAQNMTIYGPNCGDGFTLKLTGPGSVGVTFDFLWNTSGATGNYPGDFPNSTEISAQLIFPVT